MHAVGGLPRPVPLAAPLPRLRICRLCCGSTAGQEGNKVYLQGKGYVT